jgi:hypothetical protein
VAREVLPNVRKVQPHGGTRDLYGPAGDLIGPTTGGSGRIDAGADGSRDRRERSGDGSGGSRDYRGPMRDLHGRDRKYCSPEVWLARSSLLVSHLDQGRAVYTISLCHSALSQVRSPAEHENAHVYCPVRGRSIALQIPSEACGILDQLQRVVDNTPEMLAFGMPPIVLDVKDEFIADLVRMRLISDPFRFQNQPVSWQQEVHACGGTRVAWREFLRSDIRNPWS